MSNHKIPSQIGKYQVERVLGKGAMGIVYRALDEQIERQVAVKVLHEHLLDGEQGQDLLDRFKQEAKAAARCLHGNIVSVFDFGFYNDLPYIAMEYVEGVELKAQLKCETPYTLSVAADITIQILKALVHAHDKGIVHRDIKPSNIILLESGDVKVSDFGVARLDSSDLTGTGYMVGTPNYMSPEGLQGLQVDHRSDIYSVGVLFYELLTRTRPVRGLSLEETMTALDEQAHLSVQNINSIKPILRRALQPKVERRFQNAKEFIESLKHIDDMDLTDARTSFYISPQAKTEVTAQVAEPTGSEWSADMLTSMENVLAKYVGPMAHYLVRKTSKKSLNIESLSQTLAEHIPTELERKEFLHNLSLSGIYNVSSQNKEKSSLNQSSLNQSSASRVFSDKSVSGAQVATEIAKEDIDKVSKALVFYVGPLAGRLAKKSAKQASNLDDFYQRAAANIPNSQERQEFLKKIK